MKAVNQFVQKHERMPTEDELKECMNKTIKRKIHDARDLVDVRYTYIDADSSQTDETYDAGMDEYYKMSSSFNACERTAKNDHNKELIKTLILRLGEKERKVLCLKYGFDYGDEKVNREMSLGEIAMKLNLTQERVRQIEVEAVKKLKEICETEKVKYA